MRCFSIFLRALMILHVTALLSVIYLPRAVADEAADQQYRDVVERFHSAKNLKKIDILKARDTYKGSKYYDGNRSDAYSQFFEFMAGRLLNPNAKEKLDIQKLKKLADDNFLILSGNHMMAVISEQEKNNKDFARYAYLAVTIKEAVMAGREGRSAEDAFPVLSMGEADVITQAMSLKKLAVGTIKAGTDTFDVYSTQAADGQKRDVWFLITPYFDKY